MELYIIIAVVILIIIYVLALYNSFVRLNNKVKEVFATMDVYLKKRWDLIPNLVEIVKGYAKHEHDTLSNIVQLRNISYNNMSNEEKIKTNQDIPSDINKIMAIAENYPDLKANYNFIELSRELSKIEDDIANSRKYYNGVVRIYNNKVEIFPNNVFARLFGYKSLAMFEADKSERKNVEIEL